MQKKDRSGARETVLHIELRVPTYAKPEQDWATADRAVRAVINAFGAGVTGRWRRPREKTMRKVVLRDDRF